MLAGIVAADRPAFARDAIAITEISVPPVFEAVRVANATPHIEPASINGRLVVVPEGVEFSRIDVRRTLSHLDTRRDKIVPIQFVIWNREIDILKSRIGAEFSVHPPRDVFGGHMADIQKPNIARKSAISGLKQVNAAWDDSQMRPLEHARIAELPTREYDNSGGSNYEKHGRNRQSFRESGQFARVFGKQALIIV